MLLERHGLHYICYVCDFSAAACLKIALSKCLGYFIVALASIGK